MHLQNFSFPLSQSQHSEKIANIIRALVFSYHLLSLHESDKTIFSKTLSWESLYVFVFDTQAREIVKTVELALIYL